MDEYGEMQSPSKISQSTDTQTGPKMQSKYFKRSAYTIFQTKAYTIFAVEELGYIRSGGDTSKSTLSFFKAAFTIHSPS
jgi:carbonic anhydrase